MPSRWSSVLPSLYLTCRSEADVKMKYVTSSRLWPSLSITRMVASMSPLVERIMQTTSRSSLSSPRLRPSSTSLSVSLSPSDTDGKPTSITCTPMSESIRASSYLSLGDRDAGHLLAIAQRVVVDADLFLRGKFQVVGETFGVARQLFERLLKLDRLYVIHARGSSSAALRAACAPTARARPCAAARS